MAALAPAYVELHRDVVINADMWTSTPEILAAGWGFEGILGIPGLNSGADINLAALAGAGVNLDYAALNPQPTLRNLTSGGSPAGIYLAGYNALPQFADAMPIEFSWPLLPSSVSPSDFQLTLNTGEKVTPIGAALNPNYDYNERSVVVVIGEFGNRIAPGQPGAIYPVSLSVVNDGTPLMAVGPNGPVSIVGLSHDSSNPYVAGPSLVGAKLTRMSTVGDFAPPSLDAASPNDAVTMYGSDAQYRLRLYTSGGFSPDGVSGFLPTEFARYFRLQAKNANGETVTLSQTGVTYDLGVGKVQVVGLAELGAPANGTTVTYGPYYTEDHDNYFDIVLKGDAAAIQKLYEVDIPTSATAGYSDIYNPGGPGRTPVPGVTYTKPALPQQMPITVSLDTLATVSYAAQSIGNYDAADDLPVVFRLYNKDTRDHLYTDSSNEARTLLSAGYADEGVPFSAENGASALVNVDRFYNPITGDHFYTIDQMESATLKVDGSGYGYEGVAFKEYANAQPGAAAVLRFWSASAGDHLYTTSMKEGLSAGYAYEGVAWYSDAFAPAPASPSAIGAGIGDIGVSMATDPLTVLRMAGVPV